MSAASSSSSSSSTIHPSLPKTLLQELEADPVISEHPSGIYRDAFEKFRHKALSPRRLSCETEVVTPDTPGTRHLRDIYRFFKSEPEHLDYFRSGDKRTFLFLAVCEGDVPLAYECIRMGTTIDWKDKYGCTALLLGCHAVRTLEAARKAAQSVRKPTLDTPEGKIMDKDFIARRIDRTIRVVTLLVEQHADVNVTAEGETPFSIVSEIPNWTLIRLLVRHGALIPPSFTWSPTLRSPANNTRFKKLLEQEAQRGYARPPRPCPCWSGKLLSECHAATSQPYPSDFLCQCGTRKVYGKCCAKKQFELEEEWDEGDQWIRPSQVRHMVIPPEMPQDVFAASRVGMDGVMAAFGHLLPTGQGLVREKARMTDKLVGEESGVDPAFKYASNQNDFFARAWNGQLSKLECKKRMEEWNSAVDKYIRSGVDSRPKFDIEVEAKIGLNGGPLYKKCEAEGCTRTEGREVEKMKCCGSCKLIVYCSQGCQTSHWKQHKSECKTKSHREQQLPSQLALEAIFYEQTKLFAQMVPKSLLDIPPLEQEELD